MSEKKFKRYTVTAALPYANGPIHIGHLAGAYIPADTYVRYLRMKGEDVLFIGGSDEHGVPVTIRADKEGISPQEVVDKYHAMIKQSFAAFGISFDIYSRTSNPLHHQVASDFFKNLYDKGIFEEKITEQYYDQKKDAFLADRYIQGTCPNCGFESAYGDQCENCGISLSPDDLINPRSMMSDAPLIKKSTKHWYLPLDKYQAELEAYIKSHKEDWKPNVYGQCMSWINQGLQSRSMTRDLNWGIKVPISEAEGKVLYVWFDAPIGYITATQEYFIEKAKTDAQSKVEDWEPYWQDQETKLVHFIGKDNIVFHCLIFPLMLRLHGDYVLPSNVPANEYMNLEDDKISTSRNWAVWLHEYLVDFKDKQDVLRYVLTANAPDTKDSYFTWKDYLDKNNNELVATLGNFVNRAIVLTHKYFEGTMPPINTFEAVDEELKQALLALPPKIEQAIEQYKFREALTYFMDVARLGNQYMQKNEPWKLAKEWDTHKSRIETVLHLSLQIAANLAILAEPFLPFTSQKIRTLLNMGTVHWGQAGNLDLLLANQKINPTELLFEKMDKKVAEEQFQKLQEAKKANAMAAQPVEALKEEIQFDDFVKMDIRIATVLQAEKVKKSNKLLKLTLDTGVDQRIVLSGIAKFFKPEEIIGKQVCLLANLAPRKMMGVESQGMVLMAEDKDGTLRLVSPSDLVSPGSTVR